MIFAKNNVRMEKIQSQTFTHHREAILKTAKDLVEDTKALVAAATSSQEQITSTGQAAVKTMTKVESIKTKEIHFHSILIVSVSRRC